ncbi:MAG: aconitate hydratase [Clostridiales Family XIII bacterium]|jgi:aconitate hydratase|nr:aconitate hydratase [Clostridiales Family XIII bacterium]
MADTLAYKILKTHLLEGSLEPGAAVTIKIDQTLTQDSTGTMVYLQLEAMGVGKAKTELSVAYIDHNTLQTGFENADDHAFIESVAARHGILFSKPGGGICHQLQLENYGAPGKTLLGSDSHTPTCGGLGMIAIGAGGLDVAVAMAHGAYDMTVPRVLGIELVGALRPWVSAKDVILHILKEISVKGGVGKIVEYFGDGVQALSVTDRATITNMGAEHGATTSVFPSDENTRAYLSRQGREDAWIPLAADEGAVYDETLKVDLSALEPLAAMPHSPDNVDFVKNIGHIKVDQVAIGSCTNSSYTDLMKVAAILKGRKVHPDVSLVISPGSASILSKLASNGALADLIDAGARILENACGPCIGMGQSPKSGAVSLRTFNRNFKGRSGTNDADVYLVSPETAALSAVFGGLMDGFAFAESAIGFPLPEIKAETFERNDSFVVYQPSAGENREVVMGPNIKPFPRGEALPDTVTAEVALVAGDNITTDDIMPSDSRLLPYRSNIPFLANYCFEKIDAGFSARAKAAQAGAQKGSVIVGGDNYGQGSSREHAALVPLYLGVRAVLAKSFARIHRANLINSGILPLVFENHADYEKLRLGATLAIEGARAQIEQDVILARDGDGAVYRFLNTLNAPEKEMVLAGGKINAIRQKAR